MKILGISGSLRNASLNTALIHAAFAAMGSKAETELANIGELPLYNGDLDGDTKPESVARFTEQVKGADALLIATPEYNYSVTGVLKNAIDWVSRPAYRSPLAHKPTAMFGASMGPVGTARAQAHLREILGGTVTPIFPHPEFLAGGAHKKFEDGKLTDESTVTHLAGFVEKFLAWADHMSKAP